MIYKDSLGRPSAEARISTFGTKYGQPGTGYFALGSISDAPSKRWPYESKDVSHIVTEMSAEGWDCVIGYDGYNAPVIDCIHRDTQAVINDTKSASESKFATAEKGFIRFGACPKSGYSINYRDNTPEKGVSVFEAEFVGKEYRVFVDPILEATYLHVMNRPAYRIFGEIVGTGSDGEPVVKVSKKVKLTTKG